MLWYDSYLSGYINSSIKSNYLEHQKYPRQYLPYHQKSLLTPVILPYFKLVNVPVISAAWASKKSGRIVVQKVLKVLKGQIGLH